LLYLPQTMSEHEAEEGQPDSIASFSFWPPHLEKLFPVYAMGIPNPVLDSSLKNSDCFDPIWDDVRKEAMLEVPIIFFPLFLCIMFPHLLWLHFPSHAYRMLTMVANFRLKAQQEK